MSTKTTTIKTSKTSPSKASLSKTKTSLPKNNRKANYKKTVQHPLSDKVKTYEKMITSEGTLEHVENLISASAIKSGRPRVFTVKMLLVGLMLIADQGVLHLTRIVKTLNGLDTNSKNVLGIKTKITRRQVEHLYGLISELLTAENKYEKLDALTDQVMLASHKAAVKTGSIAVDGTSIESWGTKRVDKNTGEIKQTDLDAKWKKRSENSPWKKPYFGYELTAVVQIPDSAKETAPLFARTVRFRPATYQPVPTGLEAVVAAYAQIKGEHKEPKDVLADREYTATKDGSGFISPLRALGFNPIFDLTVSQIGVTDLVRGTLIIDGQPFSPATPQDLRHLIQPPVSAPLRERIDYQNKIAIRSKYALIRHGKGLKNGAQDYICPAQGGKISCPLKPLKNPKLIFASSAPLNPSAGSVCTKKFTRFHSFEMPLNQREHYGSYQWFQSMSRRNLVEGYFGNLKNGATENLQRGTIRVRGIYKTGILVIFAASAANMRLINGYAPKPKQSKPRGRKPIIGIKAHHPIESKRISAITKE